MQNASLTTPTDRRSQRYFTESVSASATDDEFDDFEEHSVIDEEEAVEGPPPARSYDPYVSVGNLQWDEDLTPSGAEFPTTSPRPLLVPVSQPQYHVRQATDDTIRPVPRDDAREDTPLLHKTTSLTFSEPRRGAGDALPSIAMPIDGPPATLVRRASQVSTQSAAQRRGSTTSRATKGIQAGQSTAGQTVRSLLARLAENSGLFLWWSALQCHRDSAGYRHAI